jgi:hypothetical protein
MKNGDLVIVKLVDGSFAIGEYESTSMCMSVKEFIKNSYLVVLRQLPNGEVSAGILDFMAPFIQDRLGVILTQKDWIGEPKAMPEEFVSEYIQRKTGIFVAKSLPK